MRENTLIVIDEDKITIGDIIILMFGAKVPADIRLLECEDL